MGTIEDLDAYVAGNSARFVDELKDFIRIPSISAEAARHDDVVHAAEYLKAAAEQAGFTKAELLPTGANPAVYAERIVDPSLPTVLVYGHYDVQPADPKQWASPPFQPEIRDGNIYGRGAVDDKGQVWMHLKAVEAYLRTGHELPVNLKLIVEGNEESNDAPFADLVEREKTRLAADAIVISDTDMFSKDVPSLTISLRGVAQVQATVHGPDTELHSGSFGGAVGNPVAILDSIIASLHDADGRVTVPGFYDDVLPTSPAVTDSIAKLPFDAATFAREAGNVPALGGEKGFSVLEQLWTRPTLEVVGQGGGYQGEGFQNTIPRDATVKIVARLVPGQDPQKTADQIAKAIVDAAPPTVRIDIDSAKGGGRAVVTSTDSPAIRAASSAMHDVFGKPVLFTGEGGSIPVVETFGRVLNLSAALVGVGLSTDGYHGPNEKFGIDRFTNGIRVIGRLWNQIGAELAGPAPQPVRVAAAPPVRDIGM